VSPRSGLWRGLDPGNRGSPAPAVHVPVPRTCP
jgi:hypothetical protein